MIEKQSKQIRQFYLAYKKWLDDRSPPFTRQQPFLRSGGLCSNLNDYNYFVLGNNPVSLLNLRDELEKQFRAFELDKYYPFHYAERQRFATEVKQNMCHLNPDRIEWVTMMCEVPDV